MRIVVYRRLEPKDGIEPSTYALPGRCGREPTFDPSRFMRFGTLQPPWPSKTASRRTLSRPCLATRAWPRRYASMHTSPTRALRHWSTPSTRATAPDCASFRPRYWPKLGPAKWKVLIAKGHRSAEEGNRTLTPLRAQRPERCVSTSFTTSAGASIVPQPSRGYIRRHDAMVS